MNVRLRGNGFNVRGRRFGTEVGRALVSAFYLLYFCLFQEVRNMLCCFTLSETTSSIYDSELQPSRALRPHFFRGMEGRGASFSRLPNLRV